jgi:hypothetical protein
VSVFIILESIINKPPTVLCPLLPVAAALWAAHRRTIDVDLGASHSEAATEEEWSASVVAIFFGS